MARAAWPLKVAAEGCINRPPKSRRRAPARRWQDALADAAQGEAVALWLVEEYGGDWRHWSPRATLPERMRCAAVAFALEHGIPADLATGQPLAWAQAAVEEMVDHLGHIRFSRAPETWREDMAQHYVGPDEAERTVIAAKESHRQGSMRENARREAKRLEDALIARGFSEQGMSRKEIAQVMGIAPDTVKHLLRLARAHVRAAVCARERGGYGTT